MSSESSYRPSSARAIILGIIAFIILMAIICGLAEVLKFAGAPFLILPEKLGWIPDVSKADVVTISMEDSSALVDLKRTGNYVIYAKDIDILMMTEQLANSSGHPWIKITNTESGEMVEPDFVNRALIPFDSALARGRPIYQFSVTEPGTYQMTFPRRFVTLWILPDQLTGHLGVILFATLIQLAIIAIPVYGLINRGLRKQREKINEIRNLKKTSDEQFWNELHHKRDAQQNGSRK